MDNIEMLLYESSQALYEANKVLLNWVDIDPVCRFFGEASDEAESNSNVEKQSTNFIMTAINKIKKAISDLLEKVRTLFLSKEEREKYEAFKSAIQKNPEFAGKTVTIKDYRKCMSTYQAAINEIDRGLAEMEKAEDDRVEDIAQSVMDKANRYCNAIGKSAQTTVTMDALLRLAENSRPAAEFITKELEKENGMMSKLEAEVGKARAAAFKKKTAQLSRKISVHNLKLKILRMFGKDVGLSGTINQVLNDFKVMFKPDLSIGANIGRAKRMHIIDDAVGSFNQHAGTNYNKRDAVNAVRGANKFAVNTKNKATNAINDAKSFAKNKIREGKEAVNKAKENVNKIRRESERFLTH